MLQSINVNARFQNHLFFWNRQRPAFWSSLDQRFILRTTAIDPPEEILVVFDWEIFDWEILSEELKHFHRWENLRSPWCPWTKISLYLDFPLEFKKNGDGRNVSVSWILPLWRCWASAEGKGGNEEDDGGDCQAAWPHHTKSRSESIASVVYNIHGSQDFEEDL